jgi:hypothetical protein
VQRCPIAADEERKRLARALTSQQERQRASMTLIACDAAFATTSDWKGASVPIPYLVVNSREQLVAEENRISR